MRIKEAMAEKQVTSAWLAEKIGISKVAMSNIVTGKNDPSVETLLKISEALEVSILYLLEMDNEIAIKKVYSLPQMWCRVCSKRKHLILTL